MTKNNTIHKKRDAVKAALVKKTAAITGLTERSIYRIIKAQRENEEVLEVYMNLLEADNRLVDYVKTIVPFELKKAI